MQPRNEAESLSQGEPGQAQCVSELPGHGQDPRETEHNSGNAHSPNQLPQGQGHMSPPSPNEHVLAMQSWVEEATGERFDLPLAVPIRAAYMAGSVSSCQNIAPTAHPCPKPCPPGAESTLLPGKLTPGLFLTLQVVGMHLTLRQKVW